MFNFSRCYKHMSQTYLDEQGPATVYEFQLLHNLANIWYCQSFSFQSFEGVAQTVKRLSAMQETRVRSLGWEDPLEKEMAIHSSTMAWKIPWTEEPGRWQPMESQRVGHDWATLPYLTYTDCRETCPRFKKFIVSGKGTFEIGVWAETGRTHWLPGF